MPLCTGCVSAFDVVDAGKVLCVFWENFGMEKAQVVNSVRAGYSPKHQRYAEAEDEDALHESGTRRVVFSATRKQQSRRRRGSGRF